MRYEIIENGEVVNTIVASAEFMAENFEPGAYREVIDTPMEPVCDPRIWWIDVGPFKDRFDTHGYPGLKGVLLGLGRTNDVCYAAFADLVGRAYVDLLTRHDELLTTFAAMATVVAAAGAPPFTQAMQHAIVDTPTTDYERHVKDLG